MNHHANKNTEQEEISINLTRLDGRVSTLETAVGSISMKIDSLASLFNASRQANWPLILTGLTVFCTFAVGVWYFIEIKVKLNSAETITPVLVQNTVSTKEREENRSDLNATMRSLSDEVSARRSGFSALQQQLVEAEGQHRHRDTAAAMQFQHLEGQVAWLYEYNKLPRPAPMTFQPSIGRIINAPIPNQ